MASLLYSVRFEREGDPRGVIRSIHQAAFGRPDEADLAGKLRAEGVVLVSLVAVQEPPEDRIVGHILFTRMFIETAGESAGRSVPAAALAPLSVLPEHQRRGVGGQLIRSGLDALRRQGERIVLVLGHPHYYSRFGFSSGKASSLAHPFPPAAYMALELIPGALHGIEGRVKYASSFGIR